MGQKLNPKQSLGMTVQDKQISTVTSRSMVFQTGFDFYTTVGGVNVGQKAISFPTPFTTVLGVVVTEVGEKTGSDPTGVTDTNQSYKDVSSSAANVANSGFNAIITTNSRGNFGASERWAFSWIAWGII